MNIVTQEQKQKFVEELANAERSLHAAIEALRRASQSVAVVRIIGEPPDAAVDFWGERSRVAAINTQELSGFYLGVKGLGLLARLQERADRASEAPPSAHVPSEVA